MTRTRCHLLGAILALAGHLAGVIGLPLPVRAAQPAAAKPVEKKAEPVCDCGCGRGADCCCCGGKKPKADPPAEADPPAKTAWRWTSSVEMQKCFGIGPAAFANLPPAIPVVRTVHRLTAEPTFETAIPSGTVSLQLTISPPTPPPRSV